MFMELNGNQYKDENGNPTNGATTGPHLHLGIRINAKYIDPLSLFEYLKNFTNMAHTNVIKK